MSCKYNNGNNSDNGKSILKSICAKIQLFILPCGQKLTQASANKRENFIEGLKAINMKETKKKKVRTY